jgi:hypothetical protein
VLYADLHIPVIKIPSFFHHIVTQESKNFFPGLWTRHLCVEGVHGDGHDACLSSLVLYMPHLLSLSVRNLPVGSALLASLKHQSRGKLRCLEMCHISNASRIMFLVGQFQMLYSLRLNIPFHEDGLESFVDAWPLRLSLLHTLDAIVEPRAIFSFIRWLGLCEFDSLEELSVGQTRGQGMEPDQTPALAANRLASFFERHKRIRTLALDVCHAVVHLFFSQTLPAGLIHVDLQFSSIASPWPPLPRTVRRISIHVDTFDMASVREVLDSLLDHAARHELPPELCVLFDHYPNHDEPGGHIHTDFFRFRWEALLRPSFAMQDMSAEETEAQGQMLLYALHFKRYGVSVIDEDGCVWPADGESGQLYPGRSYVLEILTHTQD